MSAVTFRGWILTLVGGAACLIVGVAQAQERAVYRCPGSVYTDQLTPKEAQRMGCRTLDGAPVTVVQSKNHAHRAPAEGGRAPSSSAVPAARPAAAATGGAAPQAGAAPSAVSGSALRVDTRDQRSRDSDARRILESELRKEEERLAALRRDFNNGEPERRGDERNYARYQERVAEMKAAISRKESDVAALRRELSKFGAQ